MNLLPSKPSIARSIAAGPVRPSTRHFGKVKRVRCSKRNLKQQTRKEGALDTRESRRLLESDHSA